MGVLPRLVTQRSSLIMPLSTEPRHLLIKWAMRVDDAFAPYWTGRYPAGLGYRMIALRQGITRLLHGAVAPEPGLRVSSCAAVVCGRGVLDALDQRAETRIDAITE